MTNESNEPLEVPQPDSADAAHLVATTLVGLIPFVGGADLFKSIVTPSLEKRRDRWMQEVANAIKELQQRSGVDIQRLQNDEEFVTLLVQATQTAYRTHLESKHTLLKAALINTMRVSFAFDKKQTFLNLIDRLTPTHIALLKFVEKYKEDTRVMTSVQEVFSKATEDKTFEDVAFDAPEVLTFLADLQQAGLILAADGFLSVNDEVDSSQYLATEASGTSGLPRLTTSRFACDFIEFISL